MAAGWTALALLVAAGRSASGTSGVGMVSEQQLLPGLSVSWEPMGSDSIQFTVTYAGDRWMGIGFSSSTALVTGSMHGEGQGADLFYCSGGEVQRFWATSRSVGMGTAVPNATCSQASGESIMTFSRTLAASGAQELEVTPGAEQLFIYAHASSDGQTTISNHGGSNRGGMVVDFGVTPTQAPTPEPTSAPTPLPTAAPSAAPTPLPTAAPSASPTQLPTDAPSAAPTVVVNSVATVSEQELIPGRLTASWEPSGVGGIQFTVTLAGNGWMGIGFSSSLALVTGSMHGESQGADLFYCNGGEVRRFWATSRSVGMGTAVPDATCSQASGESIMTFNRTLAASGPQELAITPGARQLFIYAHASSDGQTTISHHGGSNRGGMLVDFGVTPTQAPTSAPLPTQSPSAAPTPEAVSPTPVPTDPTAVVNSVATLSGQELIPGSLTASWEPSGVDGIQFTVTYAGNGWMGIGFSSSLALVTGSMHGEGQGADLFYCSGGEVQRFWATSRSVGMGTAVPDATCSQASGESIMTFSRTLAASGPQELEVTPGAEQLFIYAHASSDGQTTISNHASNRGGMLVDFGIAPTPAPTAVTTTASAQTPAPTDGRIDDVDSSDSVTMSVAASLGFLAFHLSLSC